jgi:hypothetical protein
MGILAMGKRYVTMVSDSNTLITPFNTTRCDNLKRLVDREENSTQQEINVI